MEAQFSPEINREERANSSVLVFTLIHEVPTFDLKGAEGVVRLVLWNVANETEKVTSTSGTSLTHLWERQNCQTKVLDETIALANDWRLENSSPMLERQSDKQIEGM
ncbi:hypothetical protein Tco_1006294 [Tanacetum coccineum]|uniref:Uncharacterized protein n=1 Tax=Tanacetum coccineum TaxID=301880 RepID=A0ABQ5FHM5_9ASTR